MSSTPSGVVVLLVATVVVAAPAAGSSVTAAGASGSASATDGPAAVGLEAPGAERPGWPTLPPGNDTNVSDDGTERTFGQDGVVGVALAVLAGGAGSGSGLFDALAQEDDEDDEEREGDGEREDDAGEREGDDDDREEDEEREGDDEEREGDDDEEGDGEDDDGWWEEDESEDDERPGNADEAPPDDRSDGSPGDEGAESGGEGAESEGDPEERSGDDSPPGNSTAANGTVEDGGSDDGSEDVDVESVDLEAGGASASAGAGSGDGDTAAPVGVFPDPEPLIGQANVTFVRVPEVVGEPLVVEATTKNRGTGVGQKVVQFEVEHEIVDRRTFMIGPGQSVTVRFTHRFETPGNKTVEVDAGKNRFVSVRARQPNFTVTDLRASDVTTTAGETVTFTAVVGNVGERGGSRPVALELFGEVVAVENVSIPLNGTARVTFTRAIRAPGTYTAAVGNESVAVTVLDAGNATTRTTTGGTSSGVPGFGPLLAVAALALAAVAALGRRR